MFRSLRTSSTALNILLHNQLIYVAKPHAAHQCLHCIQLQRSRAPSSGPLVAIGARFLLYAHKKYPEEIEHHREPCAMLVNRASETFLKTAHVHCRVLILMQSEPKHVRAPPGELVRERLEFKPQATIFTMPQQRRKGPCCEHSVARQSLSLQRESSAIDRDAMR